MMSLKTYNYLSRQQVNFRPINREIVSLYVCGLTVYNHLYSGPVDFSDQALQAAQTGVNRLFNTVRKLRSRMKDVAPFSGAGIAALANVSSLDDDFNTT